MITPTDDAGAVAPDVGAVADAPVVATDAPIAPGDAPIVVVDRPTPVVDVPAMPVDAPVSTSCDPANDGRFCDPVGTGCGSAGGPCASSSSCTCGGDHRWHCAVSTGPSCDGGVSPDDVEPAPVCSLVGVYFASFDARGVYFEFTADGRWRGATERAELATNPVVEGTYTLVGPNLSLTGERSAGGSSTCPMTDVGRYVVAYSNVCATLQLALLSDDCSGRGDTLGRLSFARQ